MIELVIFDVDGTLAGKFTLELLPGVRDFFRLVYSEDCPDSPKVAIATNQGGVGMRYWMEKKGFGNPEKYPTPQEIDERMAGLLDLLDADGVPVYVSYRFRDKKGTWTPVPAGMEEHDRWQQDWRKPLPGMLLQAMQDCGVPPERTMYVGDREDDQGAAQAAGCHFSWVQDFFNRSWEDCSSLTEALSRS
jgi:HAD superfamily hydrolase (TIGR01662 family)